MQDNGPLMRALSALISLNQPDLVLFVGEALVRLVASAHYILKRKKKKVTLINHVRVERR